MLHAAILALSVLFLATVSTDLLSSDCALCHSSSCGRCGLRGWAGSAVWPALARLLTFLSGGTLQPESLSRCRCWNLTRTSSMASCSKSQNPARSWELGWGYAVGSWGAHIFSLSHSRSPHPVGQHFCICALDTTHTSKCHVSAVDYLFLYKAYRNPYWHYINHSPFVYKCASQTVKHSAKAIKVYHFCHCSKCRSSLMPKLWTYTVGTFILRKAFKCPKAI